MAFFGVTIEKIKSIQPLQNADKLELATLQDLDFQFIVGKGEWKEGDCCLYFPIDAIIPTDLQKKLGVEGKLGGGQRNRVKTIKLRGSISQGIIGSVDLVKGLKLPKNKEKASEKITTFLKVEKYDPEEVKESIKGNWFVKKFLKWKFFIKKLLLSKQDSRPTKPSEVYDIESCERYKEILNTYFSTNPVVVTEKMEGSCIEGEVYLHKGKVKTRVNSHRNKGKAQDTHFYIAAKKCGLITFAEQLFKIYHKPVIVYGELCGPKIQGNIYKLTDFEIFVFDIKLDNSFVSYDEFKAMLLFMPKTLKVAPVLHVGMLQTWLNDKSVKEMSDGKSAVNSSTNREGVVIKLQIEQKIPSLGRSILKQRGPIYLSKEK